MDSARVPKPFAVCRTHEGDIHVLVIDVITPDMSGREVARQVDGHPAAGPILYMSGHASVIVPQGVLDAKGGVPA